MEHRGSRNAGQRLVPRLPGREGDPGQEAEAAEGRIAVPPWRPECREGNIRQALDGLVPERIFLTDSMNKRDRASKNQLIAYLIGSRETDALKGSRNICWIGDLARPAVDVVAVAQCIIKREAEFRICATDLGSANWRSSQFSSVSSISLLGERS